MGSRQLSRSAEIRARLNHPVIDSDGHTIEFRPALLDYLKDVGGAGLLERFSKLRADAWYHMTPEERAEKRVMRPAWWGAPWKNTLDRATATLPRLLHERMNDMGLDFTVLYPTAGLGYPHLPDEELRRALCRALNTYHAEQYREYSDRMAPVALIPMHTPAEAIAELEYAVLHLGGKLVGDKLDRPGGKELALYIGTGNPLAPTMEPAQLLDEFARCEISQLEDLRELFVPNFYFGCEADDPINAWAFDSRKNPLGARLRAIFSSDIGHWDVPDMRAVTAEAYELVEEGHITEEDFRDFVYGNPLKLWTDSNPEFFKGTALEGLV